jgi:signal transduction histidine kinase
LEGWDVVLYEFLKTHRKEIIARCRAKIATRPAPRPTDTELEFGVPLFLDQLSETLRSRLNPNPAIAESAARHGKELLGRGFTIAQVVHDYGGVCQAITELAVEIEAPISAEEFQTLNRCLDDAIAEAASEYGRLREHEGTERLGVLAHELRNLLNTAALAFEVLKTGSVGVGGSTGAVLGRSLVGLRDLIDRELAEVRMSSGAYRRERMFVAQFIEEVEVAATMEANSRGLLFSVTAVERDVAVDADRQILGSVVGNLLQNAFKFTSPGGHVVLRTRTTPHRVLIDVEDQCGGLPAGKAEELFVPYQQRSADRTGLGLGLAICQRGAEVNGGEIHVLNRPGTGCVFTVDLPRQIQPPPT